ncbi:type I restriction enzyme HsdR N-terminal domain-containing protein, partial [Photobacterium sp. OFAV2-7]|uniref:type I restriction enzyme HsdR N-terminal domain-containing protein n=1 Tax=Photobacterium sp. OFAV2-7 TaxID=2917748 RepID=UPI001EF5F063
LSLSKKKQKEMAELLKDASLTAIINASKVVSDRLKFITGLEQMLFNEDLKKVVKERSQLHKILAENTWIFGEEFSLTVNDKSLTEVLIKHLKEQGVDIKPDKAVTRIDGSVGIVDLMLTRSIGKNHEDEREHLVVELKAPHVKIKQKEINQIESYAFAVAEDERFVDLNTSWNFWIISNEMDAYARKRLENDDSGRGLLHNTKQLKITVKTWGQVIQECKHRLSFIQEHLKLDIDSSSGLGYLKEKYSEYTQGIEITEETPELSEAS